MRPKSDFWKYFQKSANSQFAKCLLCGKEIKTSGNTTNLKCHLKAVHPKAVNSEDNGKEHKKNRESPASASSSVASKSNTTLLDTTTNSGDSGDEAECVGTFKRQRTIGETFANLTSYGEGGRKHIMITNSILFMICKDYQPLSIVENEGFRSLLHVTAPQYNIPSRKTVSKLLDERYNAATKIYKKKLQNAISYTLTTDIWTDVQMKSFLGVTIHFREGTKMSSGLLGVYELDERHTAEYIAQNMTSICQEWNIPDERITAVVTDGAANMVSAIDMGFSKKRHIHCFAHQLNLVAEKSISRVADLIAIISKVKQIVRWFKQSVIASDQLRKAQKDEIVPKKLKQEVSTRWNSLFFMIKRFLELRDHINIIINNHETAPIMLNAKEINEMGIVMKLLEPLESATREISGEHYATSSIVIPLVFNLEFKITEVETKGQSISMDLKYSLLKELNERMSGVEQLHLLAVATLLDPRFKKIYFKNPLHCAKAVEAVNLMIKDNFPQNKNDYLETSSQKSQTTQTRKGESVFSLWTNHEHFVKEKLKGSDITNISEVSAYIRSPLTTDLTSSPLEWWETHKDLYPNLVPIAQKYLSVVATSVPTERLFSKAGQTMTDRRNRLGGEKLAKLLFLQSVDGFWRH